MWTGSFLHIQPQSAFLHCCKMEEISQECYAHELISLSRLINGKVPSRQFINSFKQVLHGGYEENMYVHSLGELITDTVCHCIMLYDDTLHSVR